MTVEGKSPKRPGPFGDSWELQGGVKMKVKFKIKGIDCANCAAELERTLQKLDGIDSCSISFITEKMVLEFADELEEEIIEKVKKVVKKEEPDATLERM